MGTLAIRQGDFLFFAHSLTWRIIAMASENLKDQPEYVRFERFLKTWNDLKRTGNFVVSQAEADRVAAMFGVVAPRVVVPPKGGGVVPPLGSGMIGNGGDF